MDPAYRDCRVRISIIATGQVSRNGFSECMVRRRVASEKRIMAVGLRQCIRPLVELTTPGHDGYPLALVPINWTVSKRPLPRSGFESVGETHCHLSLSPADLAGTPFLNRDLTWTQPGRELDS